MGEHIKTVHDWFIKAKKGEELEEKTVSLTWLIKEIEKERYDKRRPLQYKHALSNLKQNIIDEADKP